MMRLPSVYMSTLSPVFTFWWCGMSGKGLFDGDPL
jgi:hypothetical protein